MDSLEKELLFRDAEKYGYSLVHPTSSNPAQVLVKMLSANDPRLLEGVPVVLANMLFQQPDMNLVSVEEQLPAALKKRFRMFVVLTLLFSFWVPESEQARANLQNFLENREPSLAMTVEERLRKHGKVNVGDNVTLDAKRLETTFRNYVVHHFMETQATVAKKLENERQNVLNAALSELFTEKQKELLFKMLNHEPVSKSEREYYSRAVKPRLRALRNPDLQSLALNLLG
jgi:hypothetical protein